MTLPSRILLATANAAKVHEFSEMIAAGLAAAPDRTTFLSLADLPGGPPPEPEETGDTFAANARLKAVYYSLQSGMWALADDSGLEVDALGGAPGIHSARFSGAPIGTSRRQADAANNQLLMKRLTGLPPQQRTARFRCALALADGDRIVAEADGRVEGEILDFPRGGGGFGYDPYFFVPALGRTLAELPETEKHRISHRGEALRRLNELLRNRFVAPAV